MKHEIEQVLTPLDILNIFIEQHKLCSPLDVEADPYAELSFNSTIDDWRDANDLLPWLPLSKFLNEEFQISVTEEEWKSVLTPSSVRTLKDVCELISKYSSKQNIQPIKLFGQECLSAAVFLTLKKYLAKRHVDVSEIRPSTLVTEYFEKYFSEMIEQTTIISNGRQLFDQLAPKRKKTGFLNYLNILDKDRYMFLTGDIKTFRDLTLKIIEVNK
ncbi:hypothetical protein [Flavobacterium suncheonense]|uniref:Uncharacterized protein n=1 Tax=Flavobacterium suncheonense GH29-5 = DSM 17707 TaxID=1121899 RepID=A0A0A2LZT7_9FLAO|nr:hypothetical protein [Flavobacterium suncheonense]KGO85544.1 hypothetical protein Q764_14045 [Flavobacterium suncheonense GH29-5 = DSM 17707]